MELPICLYKIDPVDLYHNTYLIQFLKRYFFFTLIQKLFLESKLVSKYCLKLSFNLNSWYCKNGVSCLIIFTSGAATFAAFTLDQNSFTRSVSKAQIIFVSSFIEWFMSPILHKNINKKNRVFLNILSGHVFSNCVQIPINVCCIICSYCFLKVAAPAGGFFIFFPFFSSSLLFSFSS